LCILVLTEHFLPTVGGSITWLLNTYGRFSPDEVFLLASSQTGDHEADAKLPFAVKRVPMHMGDWDPTVPTSLWRYLYIVRQAYNVCRQADIQQIHCAKVLPEGLVAYSLRLLYNIPYLLYAHGEEIQTGLISRKFRWLLPRIYRGASAIIANSNNTMQLLKGLGVPSNKIHIVHPGVDLQIFNRTPEAGQAVRQRFNLGEAPLLLTVGRLQRRKGHDMVIKALARIHGAIPTVKYLIVGSGEELPRLQHLCAESGTENQVIFAGKVPDDELSSYYAASDVFIMPNREINGDIEGFGMVFLEANAACKPVIGGLSGGTADAIVDGVTGLRVDGENVEAIAAAAIQLLSNREFAREMGERGYRRVKHEFHWETIVKRTRIIAGSIR
jgi:phosphatidylinositol alpha-1,6-mannosyltransferase